MLPRKNRVPKGSFKNISRESKNFSTPIFTLRITNNSLQEEGRVAIIVSKKVARTAVSRNKIRRKIYSQINPTWLKGSGFGFLFFIYPKKEILESKPKEIQEALQVVFGAIKTK